MFNNEINVSLAKKNNSASPEKIKIVRGSTKQTNAERMNELVKAYRAGDAESFDELYNLAFRTAIAIAIKKSKNKASHDQAPDIAQEAILRLFRNIEKVDYVSSWLSVVVEHLVCDADRKMSNSYEVYELDAPMDDCMGDSNSRQKSELVADMRIEANPVELLERVATREAFQHVLSLLSDNHQKVIRYALIEQRKQDEIASIMGISRSTVAVHLRNAKANFRKEFAAHYDLSLFGLKSAYELETNVVSSSFLFCRIPLQKFFAFFKKTINIICPCSFI